MKCPECRGKGTAIYYHETDRDENSVAVTGFEDICHTCHGSGRKPQTNADRIRAMSDEELAETIGDFGLCAHIQEHEKQWCDDMPDDCGNCIIEWLKQPVKDGDNDVR